MWTLSSAFVVRRAERSDIGFEKAVFWTAFLLRIVVESDSSGPSPFMGAFQTDLPTGHKCVDNDLTGDVYA